MSEKKKSATAAGTVSSNATSVRSRQEFNTSHAQNCVLVWVDATIDEIKDKDSIKTISKLREIVDRLNTFTKVDDCVNFINNNEGKDTFLISSGALGQTIVPIVHNMAQIDTIYIFCGNKSRHEGWAQEWTKIKGVFTDIKHLCEVLKIAIQQCDSDAIPMSIVPNTSSKYVVNELNQSFMYTTILKEILLSIDFEQKHFQEFISYCRNQFVDSNHQLKNVDKLEREYRQHTPVWWYTFDSFLYPMLNRALRTMDIDMLITIGFFLCDLHRQIVQLHSEQFSGHHHSKSFTVYRGQNITEIDFDQLTAKKGGLLEFNHFLSTIADRQSSLQFTNSYAKSSNQVGVLFVMRIDPSVSSVPFANLRDESYFSNEEEILFSMNSVFRIEQIEQIDPSIRLWQVNLTLTSDDDPQMRGLTDCMRKETYPEEKGWFRLGQLLIKLGHYNKAEEVYCMLLDETSDEREETNIHQRLGQIKSEQGDYNKGIVYYEKALEVQKKTLPHDHPDLANSYSDIGSVYEKMGEYSKALSYDEKALHIQQKSLPPNHPNLAVSYINIGTVYESMGEYSKALAADEKALCIQQESLPHIHPALATSYNNIGSVYQKMGEYLSALSSQGKALIIFQKSLPENHPRLAISYDVMGKILNSMGDYPKALSAHEIALAIQQKNLPPNHPDLAITYNDIGQVYVNMDNYFKALTFFQNALNIAQQSLTSNHPVSKLFRKNYEDAKKHCKK